METQIIKPRPETLRKEIESNILAVNKYLKKQVGQMTWVELLRNCHPIERPAFAWRVHRAKGINFDMLRRITPKNKQDERSSIIRIKKRD